MQRRHPRPLHQPLVLPRSDVVPERLPELGPENQVEICVVVAPGLQALRLLPGAVRLERGPEIVESSQPRTACVLVGPIGALPSRSTRRTVSRVPLRSSQVSANASTGRSACSSSRCQGFLPAVQRGRSVERSLEGA